MANKQINQFTAAVTIDPVNDLTLLWQNGTLSTLSINRNTYLGLSSAPIGTTDNQTLSNKTLTNPTINAATLSGTIAGTYTLGGTPTFPASVVTLTGSQTLTNKVLTSPTLNNPSLTNATISADTLTGFTTSNSGTVYGVGVTAGVIASAALLNTVNTAALQVNSVGASNLATNAITLGYVQSTSDFTTTAGPSDITGLSVTVTIPAGGRRIRITGFVGRGSASVANAGLGLIIYDVTASAQLAESDGATNASGNFVNLTAIAVISPSPGSRTYKLQFSNNGNAATVHTNGAVGQPTFILVEAI